MRTTHPRHSLSRTTHEELLMELKMNRTINQQARLRLSEQRNASPECEWLGLEEHKFIGLQAAARKFYTATPMRVFELAVFLEGMMFNFYPRKPKKALQRIKMMNGNVDALGKSFSVQQIATVCKSAWLTFDLDAEGNTIGHRIWRTRKAGAVELKVNLLPRGHTVEFLWPSNRQLQSFIADNFPDSKRNSTGEIVLDYSMLDVILVDETRTRVLPRAQPESDDRAGGTPESATA